MPQNGMFIRCKPELKIKCHDMHHKRLVAWGYIQVAEVNFSENNLPVTNDIMFKVLLLIMINFGFTAKAVILKIAFLYGELE